MESLEVAMTDFSALVLKVRTRLGLSQEAMAQEFGVSFATINRWENGKTLPSNLARARFQSHCEELATTGSLDLTAGDLRMMDESRINKAGR